MYQQFFGLHEPPFELTSSPKYLFLTSQHQEALSNLEYGLSTYKAVTVLIGDAGTGKTTLLRRALESEQCSHVRCLYLNNPALTREEFVETLARGFSLSSAAHTSKSALLAELERKLRERRAVRESLALVVDEAHRLSDDLLEEIRLLANIETDEEKLLPLVLTAQPELAERLRTPSLRQLHQRVSLRCELKPFELLDTASYMAHRIRTAGGQGGHLFTREAVCLIHERSRGIPRTINVICDNALVGAYAQNVKCVTSQLIADVCRDFDLGERAVGATREHSLLDLKRAEEPDAAVPRPDVNVGEPAAEGWVRKPSRGEGFGDTPRTRRFQLFG